MATICSLSRPNFHAQKTISSTPPLRNILPCHLQCHVSISGTSSSVAESSLSLSTNENFLQLKTRQRVGNSILCCSVGEEKDEILIVSEENDETTTEQVAPEASVFVPVSPSDLLTMFFQAEGMMSEAAIPSVTNALREMEGISNLKVQVVEGIASVELMKQTTIQATGVASNLVETIQGSGFKLQTLNLSFEDEEEVLVA